MIASFSSDIDNAGNAGIDGNVLTLVGSAGVGSTVRVFDGGVLLGTAMADANGAWRFRTSGLLDGAHDFTSTVTDAAGKTSAASAAFSVMLAAQALAAAPTIASSLHDASVTNLAINDTADHVINATESTAVAFTISGLKGNETGAVTFTDSANHQVVVNVDANGSYAADLSTLTDGTITSSLSAANPSGITTSATGNTVTLDTDRDLTPTVSVNALDPAHVTFTISGLEGDESGTMTFTDVNDKQVVVDVGSNGSYSADLSSLAEGQVTYLVSERDAAGNIISFDPPFGLGDGSATAPAGTPQVPNLLNGYAVRPPWQVAGVDYAVGINAGTVLKDPTTMAIAGTSVDSAHHIVNVTGNNVVLNGWNFAGWSVSVTGANATVTNSDFTHGGLRFETSSVGGTVEYDKFDQTGIISSTAPLITFGTGTYVVEYNDFENSTGMAGQFVGNADGPTYVFQYNYIHNTGLGKPQGVHGDFIQIYGDNVVNDAQVNYNTVLQDNTTGAGTQGFSLEWADAGGQQYKNLSLSNNTVVIVPNASVNYAFLIVQSWINGTATVSNNYVDIPSYVQFLTTNPGLPPGTAGPFNGTVVESNDVNMVTGTYIDGSGTGPVSGPVSSTAITSISTDSNIVGDLITNDNTLTLSGTAPANSAVKVFDGSTQVGTTTANASGAWSYNTATLADGSHGFTISATSSGTTTTSAVRTVTVDTSAPTAPTITSFSPDTGTVGDGVTTASSVTLTGTAEANSTVKVFDGTTQIGTANANASGAWSFATGSLQNATHAFTAQTMDAAGNTGGASTALNVTVNAPPNLVTNGSFETGNFSGWTLGGNYGVVSAGPQTAVDGNAENGQFAANIGAVGSDATLSQAIQTTAGQHYTLSFWLANLGGGPNDFTINWNGTTLLSLANAPAQGYTQYSFDVIGTAGTSQLLISGRQDPSHWSLDAISVVPAGTQMPAAPSIDSFSTDTGALGDGVTNDSTLALTGTAPASSTVKIYDGATLLGSAVANSSGAWTYTTAALGNGAHSLTATASDAAGNTGAASTALRVTIDTAAPVAPSITSFSPDTGTVGDGSTTANVLTLTGTAEANATVKVFDGATLLGSAVANGSGAWTYTTAALANGVHSLTATATDVAGNTGAASAPLAATVTAPPGVPTITSFSPDTGIVGDGITDPAILTLTGTAVANSTVTVYDGTTLLGAAAANASGAWTYTTIPLPDGVHHFTATDTVAGVTSAASAVMNVTIDTVAPAVPTIASFSADSGTLGDHITNDSTLILTGTGEANSTVKVYEGTTLLGSAVANGSGTWTYTTAALADGAHTLTVTASDAAANTSAPSAALSVTIDTVAPNAPVIASDATVNTNQVLLTGMAEASSRVNIFESTTLLGTATADASGAWNFTTSPLSDGAHAFTATDTDAAGNTSVASQPAIDPIIGTVAPTVPTIVSLSADSGIVGDHITNDATLTLSGTADANATVQVYDGIGLLGSALADSNGAWSFGTAALKDGTYSFTATDTVSGVTSDASSVFNATVDTVAPTDVITRDVKNSNGSFTLSGTVVDNGVAGTGDTVKIYDGTSYLGSTTIGSNGQWSFTTAALSSKAVHTFTSSATDVAGNVGNSTGAAIYGTTGKNTLVSTAGNDIITGGGNADIFVFSGTTFGKDVVTDFRPQGSSHDAIQFSNSAFSSFAAVLAHAAQVGTDVVISYDAADSITLKNVSLSQLTKSDFHFV